MIAPNIIPFPSSPRTLRAYYEAELLPELDDLEKRSLQSDATALNWWERGTSNPVLSGISSEALGKELVELRKEMQQAGLAPATINKYGRELLAILNAAYEDDVIDKLPVIKKRRKGRRTKSRLVIEPPKVQRETITPDEVCQLFEACKHATYPRIPEATLQWQVLLFMFWTYGLRTEDMLSRLRWEHVLWNQKLLRFTAKKTGKLQGLPLTRMAIHILRRIEPRVHSPRDRVFPRFNTRGCCLRGKWTAGYSSTWRSQICAAVDLHEPITFQNFRETMVTNLEAIHAGLGHWAAGHSQNQLSNAYHKPDQKIRTVYDTEVIVPSCFLELLN